MSKIAIITDSTCGLPREVIEREELIVIPCLVQAEGQVYKEGVDLTAEELFDRIYTSSTIATTSLPAGEDYTAAFEEVKRRGADQVIGIFVGSNLSGTFNGARLASQDHALQVELIDSGTTAMALGILVLEAVRIVKAGDPEEAAAQLRETAERTELYALLDTLEYIRRGGRIGRVGELIANVLNIKPVLRVARNSLDVVAGAQSQKGAELAHGHSTRGAADPRRRRDAHPHPRRSRRAGAVLVAAGRRTTRTDDRAGHRGGGGSCGSVGDWDGHHKE
ncbi:MAG: DegV family protein [Caldilineaceae bacterium]